jgi:hypothetical protein
MATEQNRTDTYTQAYFKKSAYIIVLFDNTCIKHVQQLTLPFTDSQTFTILYSKFQHSVLHIDIVLINHQAKQYTISLRCYIY